MSDRVLTLRGTADFLQVSVRTVRYWIKREELPYIKTAPKGGKYLFIESRLIEWLEDFGNRRSAKWANVDKQALEELEEMLR